MTLGKSDRSEPNSAPRSDERDELRRELAALSRALSELRERVAVLEGRLWLAPGAVSKASTEVDERGPEPPPGASRELSTEPAESTQGGVPAELALAGRTLLALAGGYLLRAMAEGGAIPPVFAMLLGLAYAAFWALAADRAAGLGRRSSAGFHAAAAALVGFPLVWETTRVFQLLAPGVAAAALGGLMLLLLAVAWRHDHPVPAWLGALGGILVALILLRLAPIPFGALLLSYGVASLWVALSRGWVVLPWVTAAAANLGVALAAHLAPAGTAISLQLGLFVIYGGTFAVVALHPGRRLGVLAFSQMPASLALGYVGALMTAGPALQMALGGGGIAVGTAVYALGLRRLERSRRGDLAYLSLLGLFTLLAGSAAALPAAPLAWAALAVVATVIGSHLRRLTLTLHGALFTVAAAAGSGLITSSGYAWAAPASWSWPSLSGSALVALAAALLCLAIPQPDRKDYWEEWAHAPRLLLWALVAAGGGAAALQAWVWLLGELAGPGADAARLAVVRTAVLAASALILALASRLAAQTEAGWLVYGVLALGGLKLLGEDLVQGRPATLVLSLTLYGVALIAAPRLARRGGEVARAPAAR